MNRLRRQRKKAKVEGLKEQIEELTAKIEQLQSYPRELQELEECNKEYEGQLWSTNAEVRQIQEEIAARADKHQQADPASHRTEAAGKSPQQKLERATSAWLRQVRNSLHELTCLKLVIVAHSAAALVPGSCLIARQTFQHHHYPQLF